MKTLGLLLALLCVPLAAGEEIFSDGLESGDVSAWSPASDIVAACAVFLEPHEEMVLSCARSFVRVSGGRIRMPSAGRHLGYEIIISASAGVVLTGRVGDLICIGDRCRSAIRLEPGEYLMIAFPLFEPHGTEALAWQGDRVR